MTAVLAQVAQAKPQSAIDWSRWISVDEAARLLACTERHMRRRAESELASRGLAMKLAPRAGGKARWFVNRSLDMALAPGAVGQAFAAPDLSRYTKRQRDVAFARARCVERLREARSTWPGTQQQWIGKLIAELRDQMPELRISQRTLLRWYAVYQTPADVEQLIDQRGGDQKSSGDPSAWDYFKKLYLDDRQPKAKLCWKRTREHAQAAGLSWCSYRSCTRQLDERIPVEMQVLHRDPRRWRSEHAPYVEQNTERFAAGQCWVGDHRPLDVLCRLPDGSIGRPYITAWQDWRTRKVCADLFASPNSSTILAVLRAGIMDPAAMGGPSIVWIDNGKDYDSYTFHGQTKQQRLSRFRFELDETSNKGVFGLLGIEAHFSLAYNPQGKARMERWFATCGDHFDRTFPTYTGKSTERKPEGLAEVPAHQVPAFEHVRERFRQYVTGANTNSEHSIDDLVDSDSARLSPDEAMRRWCTTRRVMADPTALELCLMQHHKPVRVGRNGVTISVAGQTLRYGYLDPALMRFKGTGKLVHVAYDPQDLRQVKVFDHQWRFVCDALMNDTGGVHGDPLNRDHVARLAKRKAARNRSLKVVGGSYDLEYMSTEELLAHEAAKARPTETRADASSMKLVQTPLDGGSNSAQKQRVRKAAGAEHQTPGDEPIGRGLPPISRLAEFGDFAFEPDEVGGDDAPLPSLSDLCDPNPSTDAGDGAEGLSPWSRFVDQEHAGGAA